MKLSPYLRQCSAPGCTGALDVGLRGERVGGAEVGGRMGDGLGLVGGVTGGLGLVGGVTGGLPGVVLDIYGVIASIKFTTGTPLFPLQPPPQ